MRVVAGSALSRLEGHMNRGGLALIFQVLMALQADRLLIITQKRLLLGVVRQMASKTPLRLDGGMRRLGS